MTETIGGVNQCSLCGAANPVSSLYCGGCGSRLDASGAILRDQIRALLRTELKDQKVLEIETARTRQHVWEAAATGRETFSAVAA